MDNDYTGQTIDGRYRIVRLLGRGGMGAVYLGQHLAIGRQVAVKFLHAELALNAEVVKRFYREAQAASAIAHRNIIDIFDVGVSPGNEPYLVMEYLEGESLAEMLRRTGPIELPAACAVLEPTLLALAVAHKKNIVHRDLKPENIFLVHVPDEPPTVKIIDFGISKFTQGLESKLTQTGSLLGTPSYMPPEQIRGDKSLDHRADLYAIGVILYEMLTGQLPFSGEHHNALLISVLTDEPLPPGEAFIDFPVEAEPLLMRLISKDPAMRPQTAEALLKELMTLASYDDRADHLSRYSSGLTSRGFAAGDLGSEVPNGSGPSASEVLAEIVERATPGKWHGTLVPSRRRWIGFGGALAAAVVLGGTLTWLLGEFWGRTPPPVPTPPPQTAVQVADAPTPVPPVPAKSVRIELAGVPEGAKVFFDNAEVSSHSFKVAPSQNQVKLKVIAPGFKAFEKMVEPSEDRRIQVVLKKEKPPREDIEKPPDNAPPDKETPDDKKTDKLKSKIKSGSKGSKYIEDFPD